MTNRSLWLSSLALAASLAGCDRPASSSAPQSLPIPEALAAAASKPTAAARDVRGLVGLLSREAAHRPRVGVTAEQLFDALDVAGVTLTARTQYVGATMKAAFCAGGRTAGGVVIAMCEYASDADAEAGLAYMTATFDLPSARRVAHHAAVMTVVHAGDADDAVVDQAVSTFFAL